MNMIIDKASRLCQSVGWLHPYFLKGCTVSFKVRMESDPQTTCVAVPIHRQELMHNGNEWLSPNVVGTNRVSNLWEFTLYFTSMQKTTTYSRLVHF